MRDAFVGIFPPVLISGGVGIDAGGGVDFEANSGKDMGLEILGRLGPEILGRCGLVVFRRRGAETRWLRIPWRAVAKARIEEKRLSGKLFNACWKIISICAGSSGRKILIGTYDGMLRADLPLKG